MRTVVLSAVAVTALALSPPNSACAQQDKPELPKLRLAVGGKSAIFYLPLSITERLGYFRGAGLDVEIADVQSGARALQSLVGGSAEMGVGTFDHTIQMQAKGQPIVAVARFLARRPVDRFLVAAEPGGPAPRVEHPQPPRA